MRSRSLGVHGGRRRLFEQLLMPALDGAFALAENLDVAVLVRQNLKFDMPRVLDQLLQVHVGIREGRLRLRLRLRKKARAVRLRLE